MQPVHQNGFDLAVAEINAAGVNGSKLLLQIQGRSRRRAGHRRLRLSSQDRVLMVFGRLSNSAQATDQ